MGNRRKYKKRMKISEKNIQKRLCRILAAMLLTAGLFAFAEDIRQPESMEASCFPALGEKNGENFGEGRMPGVIADEIEVPSIYSDHGDVPADSNHDDVPAEDTKEEAEGIVRREVKRGALLDGSELPSYFDSRQAGFVTPVKYQNDNTCWTYSVVSAAESDLIARNIRIGGSVPTNGTLDLSEDHLAYFFYHVPPDEMGNTAGDRNIPLTDYLLAGGNHIFTTFGLANWVGLAKESAVTDWEREDLDASDFPNDVHMQNAYWINLSTDFDEVKRMILKHGSAAVSLYYSGAYLNHAAYYNPRITTVNHAAAIVGWDDNYSRENFRRLPEGDGAWLMKNSYGTTFGDGGYFWMSYEDASLTSSSAKAFVFEFEDAGNYDHIYQYDGSAGAYMDSEAKDTGSRVESEGAVANVFTVPADIQTRYQTLEAVSFALFDVNVDYSIQIYKNPTDASEPSSGEPLLEEPVRGSTSFVGYYTVPLPQSLLFAAGDTFSIVVRLSKENGEEISFFVDKTYTNGSWISFVNEVSPGESFVFRDGVWQDLAAEGVTARVKAFTDDYVLPAESILLSQKTLKMKVGESAKLTASVLPENASYTQVKWSSSDPSVAAVGEDGTVSATESGTTVITAQNAGNPEICDTCTVTVSRQKKDEKKDSENTESEKGNGPGTETESLREEQPPLGEQPGKAEPEKHKAEVKISQRPLTGDESKPEVWILVMLFALLTAAAAGKKIE